MSELPDHRALPAAVDRPWTGRRPASLEVPHPTERLDAALLARMTDPDPAERVRALDRVFHLVDHQNTVYRATPPVADETRTGASPPRSWATGWTAEPVRGRA
ncbi:hypothetical protein [Kitasatospora sp. NPDC004272]